MNKSARMIPPSKSIFLSNILFHLVSEEKHGGKELQYGTSSRFLSQNVSGHSQNIYDELDADDKGIQLLYFQSCILWPCSYFWPYVSCTNGCVARKYISLLSYTKSNIQGTCKVKLTSRSLGISPFWHLSKLVTAERRRVMGCKHSVCTSRSWT